MIIDKNTVIYGSFSTNPGNQGAARFNQAFQRNNINAIYKSFKVEKIEDAFSAAKILRFGGFTISMPFKEDALQYCDIMEERCQKIKSVNTVILNPFEKYIGCNSDYYGIKEYFTSCLLSDEIINNNKVFIIGMGAYARTANLVFEESKYNIFFINSRNNLLNNILNNINNSIIFNASPLVGLAKDINNSNLFIDCDANSYSGKKMSFYQARHQFYEIFRFPRNYIFEEAI